MKVTILNTSEAKGGAAIVSHRLTNALADSGIDAKMLVVDRASDDSRVDLAGTKEQRQWAFLRERFGIWLANGLSRRDLFKVSTAAFGVDVLSHPWIKAADIVCLNWINQGMLSLRDIARLGAAGKKIVWTMHDMWCCTGICHHAFDCRQYAGRCGDCRFMRFPHSHDLSRRVWERKKRILDKTDIHFVAVSNWLADCCRQSALLRDKPLTVIPNALPTGHFSWNRSNGDGKKVITMGAARLDDPIKGFELLTEAANIIAERHPQAARQLELQLFGSIRDNTLLDNIRLPLRWLGPVAPDRIPDIYRAGDIVVSPSHFETLPTTLVEGLAAGCLAVAFDRGGQRDIITHLKNGYLAEYPDASALADGLLWAASCNPDRKSLHDDVASRFSEKAVAEAYTELFTQLLKK